MILTAAHCALAKADGHRLSSVRIGEFDYSKDPDCADSGFCAPPAINHAISHVVVHPDYINGQYHHDIALLILRTPINYTISAQPICLQRDRTGLIVGKRATVIYIICGYYYHHHRLITCILFIFTKGYWMGQNIIVKCSIV